MLLLMGMGVSCCLRMSCGCCECECTNVCNAGPSASASAQQTVNMDPCKRTPSIPPTPTRGSLPSDSLPLRRGQIKLNAYCCAYWRLLRRGRVLRAVVSRIFLQQRKLGLDLRKDWARLLRVVVTRLCTTATTAPIQQDAHAHTEESQSFENGDSNGECR